MEEPVSEGEVANGDDRDQPDYDVGDGEKALASRFAHGDIVRMGRTEVKACGRSTRGKRDQKLGGRGWMPEVLARF